MGKLLDIQYQFVKRRFEKKIASDSEKTTEADSERTLVNIIDYENFPMEESRLLAQNIWMLSLAIATTGYGWAVQSKTSIAVPLILQFIGELFLRSHTYCIIDDLIFFLVGYTTVAIMVTNTSLIVDMFPSQSSSATAAVSF